MSASGEIEPDQFSTLSLFRNKKHVSQSDRQNVCDILADSLEQLG